MKTQNQTMLSENTLTSRPTDIIAGFPVPATVHPASFFFSTPEKRNPSQSFLFPMPVVSVMSTP